MDSIPLNVLGALIGGVLGGVLGGVIWPWVLSFFLPLRAPKISKEGHRVLDALTEATNIQSTVTSTRTGHLKLDIYLPDNRAEQLGEDIHSIARKGYWK